MVISDEEPESTSQGRQDYYFAEMDRLTTFVVSCEAYWTPGAPSLVVEPYCIADVMVRRSTQRGSLGASVLRLWAFNPGGGTIFKAPRDV